MNKKILFFDGECLMCNSLVHLLFKYNSKKNLYYSPLQGETAKKYIDEINFDSVVYYTEGKTYFKSQAVKMILNETDFPLTLLKVFTIFPNFLLDIFYDIVARLRLFLPKKACKYNPDLIPYLLK